jgi:hypothetical protein
MKLALRLLNCFLLIMPLLVWNLVLGPRISNVHVTSDVHVRWLREKIEKDAAARSASSPCAGAAIGSKVSCAFLQPMRLVANGPGQARQPGLQAGPVLGCQPDRLGDHGFEGTRENREPRLEASRVFEIGFGLPIWPSGVRRLDSRSGLTAGSEADARADMKTAGVSKVTEWLCERAQT